MQQMKLDQDISLVDIPKTFIDLEIETCNHFNGKNIQGYCNDGFKWHKYGQKNLMDKNFLRSYYKCSNRATNCPAKKSIDVCKDEASKIFISYTFQHNHEKPPSKKSPPSSSPSYLDPLRPSSYHFENKKCLKCSRENAPSTSMPNNDDDKNDENFRNDKTIRSLNNFGEKHNSGSYHGSRDSLSDSCVLDYRKYYIQKMIADEEWLSNEKVGRKKVKFELEDEEVEGHGSRAWGSIQRSHSIGYYLENGEAKSCSSDLYDIFSGNCFEGALSSCSPMKTDDTCGDAGQTPANPTTPGNWSSDGASMGPLSVRQDAKTAVSSFSSCKRRRPVLDPFEFLGGRSTVSIADFISQWDNNECDNNNDDSNNNDCSTGEFKCKMEYEL